MKQKLLYNFSSKIQSLGPGSSVINITSHIDQSVTGLSYLELSSVIGNSKEWKKYRDDYELYKIQQIAVTIYPNDALDNDPTYINLDWFGNVDSADGIKYNDSTKIVFNDLKKIKSFFFKPPNVLDNGILLRKFNKTSSLPGARLYFLQTSGNLRGRVDVRIVFKVPTEYVNANKLNLKSVSELAKLDEDDMINDNLKIINNSRLTGVHQTSFSITSKEEEEIPEEEKLEEDEEELPKKITEDEWSLFKQICKEDEEEEKKEEEKKQKIREKRKEKRNKRNKLKKEMKQKIKKSKLFKKLLEKEKDKILKEAKSDATFAEQIIRERREQAEKHYQKRKELGKKRKEQKEKSAQENPIKVCEQKFNERDAKRMLLKRNERIIKALTSEKCPKQELNKIWKEKEKLQRAMQHLKNRKLDDKDNSYLCDLKNHEDNIELFFDC